MAAGSGKREKLVIEAYEKPDFSSKVDDYVLQVNPENYERTAMPAVREDILRLSNGESVPANRTADKELLKLTFVVDSTGAIPGCDDVLQNIKKLRKLCLDINGNIHRSNYLKVRWGSDFLFRGIMTDLETDFMLFKPDGDPVRAKLKASFQEFIDPVTRAAEQNKSSPDLSHIVTVVDGDDLPGLCYKVYGDPKYYIQVAQFNNLVDFNSIKPNQRIIFPRLSND
ncbi:MAG: LysM peptidoglycan-binding domain-containing protein [Bacteroidota bacterium]